MQHVPVTAVHRHMGYRAVPTGLFEEDEVATLEVGPGYPLAGLSTAVPLPILFDRAGRQFVAEMAEEELGEARAIFLPVCPGGGGGREVVGGAEVLSALPYYGLALTPGGQGAVDVLTPSAAFGRRKVVGRRRGGAPDERDGVGDDFARTALRGEAHEVAIAGLHLEDAELDPCTPVPGLVHLYPLRARGGLHAEPRSAAVALPYRPPGVEGVVA